MTRTTTSYSLWSHGIGKGSWGRLRKVVCEATSGQLSSKQQATNQNLIFFRRGNFDYLRQHSICAEGGILSPPAEPTASDKNNAVVKVNWTVNHCFQRKHFENRNTETTTQTGNRKVFQKKKLAHNTTHKEFKIFLSKVDVWRLFFFFFFYHNCRFFCISYCKIFTSNIFD